MKRLADEIPRLPADQIAEIQANRIVALQTDSLVRAARESQTIFRDITKNFSNRVHQILADNAKAIAAGLSEVSNNTRELLAFIDDDFESFLLFITDDGWFIDPDMSLQEIVQIRPRIGQGQSVREEVTLALVDYFNDQIDEIRERAIRVAPHRKAVLVDAFEAHANELYNLSIPVMVAQADGILAEHCEDNSVFRSRQRQTMIEGNTGASWSNRVLRSQHPLWSHQREPSLPTGGEMNRHEIMHGKDWLYGNNNNSLRVMSFLNFVCHVSSNLLASHEGPSSPSSLDIECSSEDVAQFG